MVSCEDLKHWDRQLVWHAFTQMAEYEPLIVGRAEGCWLEDLDGRRFLDGVSSLWCNVHGHRHPKLDAALRRQLDQVAHVTSLGMSNPTTIQLAKRLVDISPGGLQHVFFSGDGSCSVEVALKMSFQYWHQRRHPRPDKTRFVACGDAYHGDTLGSVSVGGVARFHQLFRPLLFDAIRVPAPDSYRLPPGVRPEDACQHYLGQLERTLAEHAAEVAAVVIEPLMQCAAGMIRHPTGYLRGVRELTRRYDVHLIADEVATGFGRTGAMFACEREQVEPDFLCVGKGLTGGYLAMAATLTTDDVWQAFLGTYAEAKTFFHGHTYGGNPLAAAVALASLDTFEEEGTLQRVAARAQQLEQHLTRIARHPHVGSVRQCGLIVGIELVEDRVTQRGYPLTEKRGWRVCEHAMTEGVWLRPLGNVVVIMPPLSISETELDTIATAVERGIERATV